MKLDSSQVGLQRAANTLRRNAHDTASHGLTPGASKRNYVDLTVERLTTRTQFSANLEVLKTEDELKKSIIDIFA
jgi:hypothetical protein